MEPSLSAAAGPHPIELAGLLHELTAHLVTSPDLATALDRLAAFTRLTLPETVRCVASLVGDGTPIEIAAAGADLGGLDEYGQGLGPSLEATRTRTTVTVTDLGTDPRWPELAGHGPLRVAAVPMDVKRHSVGALTVFLDGAGDFEPSLLITLMAFAGHAEVLLGEAQRRGSEDRMTAAQIATLRAEAAVDHAVGVIVAQRGCDPTEAYAVLHETAQRLDLRPGEVAARLVDTAMRRGAPSSR
jgi:hypothetical protein